VKLKLEKNFHTQTHTRHPDWLCRASQHARGATKNFNYATYSAKHFSEVFIFSR